MIAATQLPAPNRIAGYLDNGAWRDQLLWTYLNAVAVEDPERLAVIDDRRAWTYGELDRLIEDVATALRTRDIGRGDVVAWQLPNWVEALAVHHAALRIGAVSNPVIPIYRHRELAFILKQGGARILFTPFHFRGFDYLNMIDDIQTQLPALEHVVVVRPDADTGPAIGFDKFCVPAKKAEGPDGTSAFTADDISLLLYTSGTTSDPKGVLHTHKTLDYENRSIIDQFDLSRDDVVFMPSPVGHITGILYGLHLPFMLGSSVVLQDVWEPGAALRLIDRYRCSMTIAATPFLHGLVYHPDRQSFDLDSMRVFACGGADVAPELIDEAQRTLGCFATRIYGSSEFPTLSSCRGSDPLVRRASTDGRPIGFAEAQTVDVDENGVGELLVRGPELFVGYLDPSLNAEAFDGDGWFRTGDLATIDSDGYVTIAGRLKDIIIRGGENISAKEVEDLLFGHPAVKDVAIVGMPDPVLVERTCAYVVPRDGAAPTLTELTIYLETRQLARQKLPERLELVVSLPRTASGKVQKFKLREDIRKKIEGATRGAERAN